MIDRSNGTILSQPALAAGGFDPSRPPEPPAREIDPRRIWKTLARRRRLLFGVWAAFVVAILLFSILQPKKYTVSTKLIAGGGSGSATAQNSDGSSGTNLPILNALLAANGQQSSETYADLIQQSPVAQEVIDRLHLHAGVGELLGHLFVHPVTNTSILSVSVTWKDPATAAAIANAFAATFVDRERSLVAHQADSAIAFLQRELPAAETHMRAAQEALAAYQTRTGIADLPTQTTAYLTSINALETKAQQAQVDGLTAAAQLDAVQQQLAQTPETIVGQRNVSSNPVSGTLQQQLATAQVQLNAARKQYTDSFPTVIALKSQVSELQRELKSQPVEVAAGEQTVPNPLFQQLSQQAATLQGQIASANTQAAALDRQRAEAQPRLDRLPVESRRIGDLQRSEKSAEGVYDALQRKYQDALISRTTALSDVAITQPADASVYALSPNVGFNVVLGVIVGAILGITVALLSELFDDRFRTADDVKERLALPVLATIPLYDALPREDNVWARPLAVESFYQLVAALRYSSPDPPRVIAFTSADQGDGKSTVAMNVAISLGAMKARTLIIDADLRRPSLHTKLGVKNDSGLSDVLVGMSTFDNVVRPTEHAGVSLLSSGRSTPNPVGLLQSEGFDRLLKTARERYDFVLVDGPALRSIVDGVVLGLKSDGTVLVVSSSGSETRAVRAAIDRLRSAPKINLLGVVLNRARADRRDVSDYYLGGGRTVPLPAESLA